MALFLLATALLIAGCGKTGPEAAPGGGPLRKLAPVAAEGAVSVTTRNTSRVGGAEAAVDAAAVARVVYEGLTAGSRPQVVVLVNQRDWPAALVASSLAGAPLNAPILYAEGDTLPQVTLEALEAMHPTGAASLGGAQVIRVATRAELPARYALDDVPASDPASMAAEIQRRLVRAAGSTPHQAIVLSSTASRSLQMPAAGLAAESGAPILMTAGPKLAAATATTLRSMHHPSIYVMGAAGISRGALGALARLGRVTQIPESGAGEQPTPAAVAIAAARYTDGVFGWGVKEPGHGLVFASASRPLDAPAAALLSATGDYGPLLLLEAPGRIPPELAAYLGDIQPAYAAAPEFQPVRGVYNHGWLIGDERAISLDTQAELDSLLEISPRKQAGAEETSVLQAE
ncbi:MAG TPA: cell wall-binding repeat-containing protein [Solirubrobacteraceae bacterium]|nr:cell wall-binding repeat-containing protein [Solirubrobacteraceae bacterium]